MSWTEQHIEDAKGSDAQLDWTIAKIFMRNKAILLHVKTLFLINVFPSRNSRELKG